MFPFDRFAYVSRAETKISIRLAGRLLGLTFLLALLIPEPLAALGPGDRCPDFDLPRLSGTGRVRLADLLAQENLTVLVIWNRGCPHCTEVALGVDELVAFLAPYPAQVVPILFGPDEPVSLRSLLEAEEVQTPHLWDASGRVASAYGLGMDHLGVFVVEERGEILDRFDSMLLAAPATYYYLRLFAVTS